MKVNPAFAYLITAALLWGATIPIMKFTLTQIPIFSLITIRMTFASLILLPFIAKQLKVKSEDLKTLFLAAIFGTNLNLAFFFLGLKYSLAINASIILATTPIFTLILAQFFLKEKFTIKLLLGSTLAMLGVIFIVGVPIFHLNLKSTIGNLALVASALAWVGHEIFSKKVLTKYPPATVAFYTTSIGAIVFSPLFVLELFKSPTWYYQVNLHGFLGLLYGILFASLIAYVCWQKGLSLTTAGEASFVFYLMPLSGILFSVILLKESFPTFLIFGAILIFLGVVLAEFHRKSRILHK